MRDPRQTELLMQRLTDGVVADPGALDSETRRVIFDYARSAASQERSSLPEPLASFVDKVAESAYKTMDRDFETLRRAGYSEDAIFEITVCTAVGAGMKRIDAGLKALEKAE